MGYTSGTTMEDRGLRDIERWRDKIEVRLDNRQVFFLFFGSALVACMLFVLGVIVGKRLESRGRAVSPEIEDPLALLDKVATSPRPAQSGVTFPQALFGAASKATAEKHAKKTPSPVVGAADDDATSRKQLALARPGEGSVQAVAPMAPVAENKPAAVKPAAKAESKPAEVAATEKSVDPAPSKAKAAKPAEVKESKPMVVPTVAAAGDSKSKGHYSLQLSSFQDKAEAETFAQKFEGEHPYMVVSEIPGKGTWYRVRVGDYASAKDAVAAKQSFEKKHSVIAYVAQK
jgi:DedD protein